MANSAAHDIMVKAPEEVLSSPALLFLFYRIEQILGIKAGYEPLKNLNDYMEKTCGSSFIENPAAYEHLLTSREKIFDISKFITVNETYFFREGAHFELLASLMPELSKLKRQIHILSAASSIGCEAYSIAMLFDYYMNNGINIDYAIDAFDVDNEAIEIAKNARYSANALRSEGKNWNYILESYLIPDKKEIIVCDKIKKRVRFFPHNIMRGIDGKYDIIFFRNALIYFSTKNRYIILNHLAQSLYRGGLLFLGTSETSSISHPLFATRFSCDVFYFQKINNSDEIPKLEINLETKPLTNIIEPKRTKQGRPVKKKNLTVYCPDVSDILKTEEGKQNASFVMKMINENSTDVLFGSQLAAAAIYFLQSQELEKADLVLSCLEKNNKEACTGFLRGEYYYLLENNKEAEKYYEEACVKDKCFWPAFYRIAVLSSDSNRTRYEYKIKKTIESIESADNSYECFMGGFSSDYFLRILEKKLT